MRYTPSMLWALLTLLWLALGAWSFVAGRRRGLHFPNFYRPIHIAEDPTRYWLAFAGLMTFSAISLAGVGLSWSEDQRAQRLGSLFMIVVMIVTLATYWLGRGRIGNVRLDANPLQFWLRAGALSAILFLLGLVVVLTIAAIIIWLAGIA